MKVKVCGLREPDNIAAVAALGVDYLGLILHPDSKRYAASESLAGWIEGHRDSLGATELVGVFVNAEVDTVLNAVHDYRLDWVQLHGDESAGYCQELKLMWSVNTLRKAKICKAFSVDRNFDFRQTAPYVSSCPLFVFDTGGKSTPGGTGVQWDWHRLTEYDGPVPFLLSGGIGPGDAGKVRRIDHPQLRGVDLNSRFENAPGMKDTAALQQFIGELNA